MVYYIKHFIDTYILTIETYILSKDNNSPFIVINYVHCKLPLIFLFTCVFFFTSNFITSLVNIV